jgi:hypothetical protein
MLKSSCFKSKNRKSFYITPMLGLKKKRKTGAQIAAELGDSLATKVDILRKRNLPLKAICVSCIIIFSLSICFGFYGLASRHSEI